MIEEIIEAFAAAAYRLKLGGFDGCEIMASHCHLIDQFWTLNVNQRDDAYGTASLATRMKFGIRVMERVRERVGADFIGTTTRPPLLTRLFKKGVQFFHHLKAEALRDGCLIARNEWTGELAQVGPYDGFVYAYGGQRVDTLSDPLKARGLNVRTIGDAFSPRSLQHAILEGHQDARDL